MHSHPSRPPPVQPPVPAGTSPQIHRSPPVSPPYPLWSRPLLSAYRPSRSALPQASRTPPESSVPSLSAYPAPTRPTPSPLRRTPAVHATGARTSAPTSPSHTSIPTSGLAMPKYSKPRVAVHSGREAQLESAIPNPHHPASPSAPQIGRASCRERV